MRRTALALVALSVLLVIGWSQIPVDRGCQYSGRFDPAWARRQRVQIQEWTDGDLVDFTVPVTMTAEQTAFWSAVRPDGADVRFADCDGRSLPFEIDTFDHRAQRMVAWVRLPHIGAKARVNSFFLYYANPNAAAAPPAEVWGPGYQLVLHMNSRVEGDTFGLRDSSSRKHQVALTDRSMPVIDPAGVVGGALVLNGTRGVSVPDHEDWSFGRGDWTVESWIRLPPAAPGRSDEVFSHGLTSAFNFYRHSGGFLALELTNNGVIADMSFGQAQSLPNAWTYIALIRDKGTITLWCGGRRFEMPLKAADLLFPDSGDPLLFGAGAYGFASMALDEVRISKGVARSQPWIEASTMTATGKMLALGSPESWPFQ